MKEMEPVLYLIPSNQLAKPDDYIFIDNEQDERFKHLSNWETEGSRVPIKLIKPRVN